MDKMSTVRPPGEAKFFDPFGTRSGPTVTVRPIAINSKDSSSEGLHLSKWPETCRYYNPFTMDARYIRDLLYRDSEYVGPPSGSPCKFESIDIADRVATLSSASLEAESVEKRLQVKPGTLLSTKIFFVAQKRLYFDHHTISRMYLHLHEWEDILDKLSVPPNFLEFLHSNNGGFFSQVSYCAEHTTEEHGHEGCADDSVSAYHIGVKIGEWGSYEYAVYARYEFNTGKSIILAVGTTPYEVIGSLASRAGTASHFGLFPVLLHLTSSWLHEAEGVRWKMDFATQALEARTGFSSLRGLQVDPLPAEQLAFTKDLQVTADYLRNIAFGSSVIGEAFSFLDVELAKFAELRCDCGLGQLSLRQRSHLQSALIQKHSLAKHQRLQIQDLSARVNAQLEVTKTLIVQRDTQVNIEIAKAAKRDSELMRGITVITMVFLPATFVATFFSMVFFHVGDETDSILVVDSWIWLYPSVTIPLTVMILAWYRMFSWKQRRLPPEDINKSAANGAFSLREFVK